MKKRLLIVLLIAMVSLFTLGFKNTDAASEYEFVSDGNSTVTQTENSTIYTLTATRSYIVLDVTDKNVDKTKVFISLQYKYTGTVEGFETYVNYVDSNTKVTAAGLVALTSSVGSPWNLKEHTVTDGYIISTLQIDNYTKDLDPFTNIAIRLKGGKGMTFELFDFAITTDGVHGFDLSIGKEPQPEPEVPAKPVYKFEGASSSATVVDNVCTFAATSSAIKVNTDITDLSGVHIAIKYKSNGVTGIETVVYGNGSEQAWPAVILPKGWNVTETVYDEFTVATVDVTSAVSAFTALKTVRFNIACSEGATLEILDFAITTDGVHGFELPMVVGDVYASGSKYTLSSNEKEELVVSYGVTAPSSWDSVKFDVKNYNRIDSLLEFTFTPENDTYLCFSVGDEHKGHVLYEGGQKHKVVVDLNDPAYAAAENFTIKIYFDANPGNDVAKSVTFHSIEFKSALAQTLNKYYNKGNYVRNTNIYLNKDTVNEISNYFHANVTILERQTYFKGNELWMSTENGEYSYYGSADGNLTWAKTNRALVTPENAVVAKANTSMEDFYTTMYDIKNLDVKWTYENGVYTSKDAAAIQAFLDFTAPCFLNFNEEQANYLTFTKVTIQETKDGLMLRLWVSSLDAEGKLTSDTIGVFSQAVITEGPKLLEVGGTYPEVVECDSTTGLYTYEVSFNIWNRASFTFDGVVLNPENTTFVGLFNTTTTGATWTADLYSEDKINWIYSATGKYNYLFIYDPANNTLTATTAGLVWNGTWPETGQLNENGEYELTKAFNIWNRVGLTYNGKDLTLDDITVTGDIAATGVVGKLYHEGGKFFYAGSDKQVFKLTFNPETMTLNIKAVKDETGLSYVTRYNGTQDANPVEYKATANEDGTYTINFEFSKSWGYITLVYNGVTIDTINTTYNISSLPGIYQENGSIMCNDNAAGHRAYVLTYDPANNTLTLVAA